MNCVHPFQFQNNKGNWALKHLLQQREIAYLQSGSICNIKKRAKGRYDNIIDLTLLLLSFYFIVNIGFDQYFFATGNVKFMLPNSTTSIITQFVA